MISTRREERKAEAEYEDDEFEEYSEDEFEDDEPADTRSRPGPAESGGARNSLDDILRRDRVRRRPGPLGTSTPSPVAPEAAAAVEPRAEPAYQRGDGASRRAVAPTARPLAPHGGVRVRHPRAKRGERLREEIQLTEERAELYAQAPLGPMDLYHRSLLGGLVRQMTCQTNSDAQSIEIQTDPIPTTDQTTQFPEDLSLKRSSKAPGGERVEAEGAAVVALLRRVVGPVEALLEENTAIARSRAEHRRDEPPHPRRTGEATILAPTAGGRRSRWTLDGPARAPAWITGRRVTSMVFQRDHTSLVIGYGRPTTDGDTGGRGGGGGGGIGGRYSHAGVIGVFSARVDDEEAMRPPRHLLLAPDVPTAVAVSPGRGHTVVAGLEDGSLALWDLRESEQMHQSVGVVEEHGAPGTGLLEPPRRPSYTTETAVDGFDRFNERAGGEHPGHRAPVVRLEVISAAGDRASRSGVGLAARLGHQLGEADGGWGDGSTSSFQVASFDSSGLVIVWTVLELPESTDKVSEVDLGLGLGSRVKLIRTAVVDSVLLSPPPSTAPPRPLLDASLEEASLLPVARLGFGVRDGTVLPGSTEEFVVACSDGRILHGRRNGQPALPRVFAASDAADMEIAAEEERAWGGEDAAPWVSVDASPLLRDGIFVAVSADGMVALFQPPARVPRMVWYPMLRSGATPVSVRWSRDRPGVFALLDSGGTVHAWDLTQSVAGPVATQAGWGRTHDQKEAGHFACWAWNGGGPIPPSRGWVATAWTGDAGRVWLQELGEEWVRGRGSEGEEERECRERIRG